MENKRSVVAVVPCDSYDEEKVYAAMRAGIDRLGGIRKFADPKERILVKPNFLSAAAPESAVTTHPAVIRAMLRILQENGYADVTYGDSPGHGSSEGAASKLGLSEANTYGARPADMGQEVTVPFPEGRTAKEFIFAKSVTEADAIISLCKMKTHALERITGAVKNVYGLICGYRKAAGHVKYPNASVFARMLADIHRCVKPRLHIMDGIVAMEGNGPGSGDPVPMNVLLFSEDPVAIDAVFCHLVGLDPELVPTNTQGAAMGIGTYREDEMRIELLDGQAQADFVRQTQADFVQQTQADSAGRAQADFPQQASGARKALWRAVSVKELQAEFGNMGFDVDRKGTKRTFLSRYSDLMTRFAKRPHIDAKLCVKCGVCVNHCPVPGKAVDFKNGRVEPPVYDYKKCIRCYCCQEMCPRHAITAGRGK